jgi:hypothetical protein
MGRLTVAVVTVAYVTILVSLGASARDWRFDEPTPPPLSAALGR